MNMKELLLKKIADKRPQYIPKRCSEFLPDRLKPRREKLQRFAQYYNDRRFYNRS
mgnify:CR=1 FL=1